MAVAHNKPRAERAAPAASLGQALRRQRQATGLPVWRLGQELKENPESIRALESGKRPITQLARRLILHFQVDTRPLARQLKVAAEAEIGALPEIEQLVMWDALLLAVRRHTPGNTPIIRLEEHGVKSKRTKGERLHSPAELLPRNKTLPAPRLHILASATS
jgi:hypothetical protein